MAKKENKKIKVFALGGLNEVGKNCYGIDYDDHLFVIDAGILFPDSHLPGVDYVIPDFTYLKENEDRIVGLFITHGHEDHIGGIPYLLKQVNIKNIYAAGIAVDLIKAKLHEFPEVSEPNIIVFNNDSEFDFDGTKVSFVRLNHSIPDEHAIVIHTKEGNIIHTGDFKIDFTPVGPKAEYDKLTELSKEGVLLLLSDSTNAMNEGFSKSETAVGDSIADMFSHIEGRIIIATFASNLYRISQIVDAAIATNRKIAVFGRSMETVIEIGKKTGYITPKENVFIAQEDINNYKFNEVTILCTGSQGEPMAALSRVANGSHKIIQLIPGDTVIFSSSPIPGNAESVNRTVNALYRAGCEVIVNSPLSDTHTSGHANQGELKLLHSLIKPKYFMPIHGESRMLKTHAVIASTVGCPLENTFILKNGQVLSLDHDSCAIDGEVPAGVVYIEGNRIGNTTKTILEERRILENEGMFSLVFTFMHDSLELVAEPQVVSRGFIYLKGNEELTKLFATDTKEYLLKLIEANPKILENELKEEVQNHMKEFIYSKTDRYPMVSIIFMHLNQ